MCMKSGELLDAPLVFLHLYIGALYGVEHLRSILREMGTVLVPTYAF